MYIENNTWLYSDFFATVPYHNAINKNIEGDTPKQMKTAAIDRTISASASSSIYLILVGNLIHLN